MQHLNPSKEVLQEPRFLAKRTIYAPSSVTTPTRWYYARLSGRQGRSARSAHAGCSKCPRAHSWGFPYSTLHLTTRTPSLNATMTFIHHRLISLVPLTLIAMIGLLASASLTGCHTSQYHQVAIEGAPPPPSTHQTTHESAPQTPTTAFSVDINNPAGGVVLIADDTLQAPVVQARFRGRGHGSATDRVRATQHGSMLTVTRTSADDSQTLIDLTVWVPQSDGVTIRTSFGSARLVRVGGPIDVELGTAGAIELRTQTPLTQGVRLVTPEGWIKAHLPALSTGSVELRAPEGKVFVRSRVGELHETAPEPGGFTGILNTDSAAITMLTGKGDVTLELSHKPFQSEPWPKD